MIVKRHTKEEILAKIHKKIESKKPVFVTPRKFLQIEGLIKDGVEIAPLTLVD